MNDDMAQNRLREWGYEKRRGLGPRRVVGMWLEAGLRFALWPMCDAKLVPWESYFVTL